MSLRIVYAYRERRAPDGTLERDPHVRTLIIDAESRREATMKARMRGYTVAAVTDHPSLMEARNR